MNWEEAESLIYQHIVVGVNLNPDLKYRYVLKGPYYSCSEFDGGDGYLIQIGSDDFIEVPFSMLETLFTASLNNDRIYRNSVFAEYYPDQLYNHGCYVQVVGKIFELAGVAVQQGNNFHIQ